VRNERHARRSGVLPLGASGEIKRSALFGPTLVEKVTVLGVYRLQSVPTVRSSLLKPSRQLGGVHLSSVESHHPARITHMFRD